MCNQSKRPHTNIMKTKILAFLTLLLMAPVFAIGLDSPVSAQLSAFDAQACMDSGGLVGVNDFNFEYCVCPEGTIDGSASGTCSQIQSGGFEDACVQSGGSWRVDTSPGSQYGGECFNCPAGTRSDGADCEPTIDSIDTDKLPGAITVPGQDLGCDPSVASTCEAEDTCTDLENDCALIDRINGILNLMGILTLPIITLMIVIGGIQYSAANGNPSAVQAAKDRIYKALLALVSFFLMWSFLQWLIPGGIV